MKGLVSDIQRFSLHDGPGIRTTVFLKGCNLHCAWCHNPETLLAHPELQFLRERCIGCAACVNACPQHCHLIQDEGIHLLERGLCLNCGNCSRICYAGALSIIGREMSIEEVMDEVRSDLPFYQESGGGVTISGGEPLMQATFTRSLLHNCQMEKISTAIETNLCYPWQLLADIIPELDLLICDIKMLDPQSHYQWTGIDNRNILTNLAELASMDIPIIVRTPLVAGINDDPDIIAGIANLLSAQPNLLYYELLPYHPLGTGKSLSIGKTSLPHAAPSAEKINELLNATCNTGIQVRCNNKSIV